MKFFKQWSDRFGLAASSKLIFATIFCFSAIVAYAVASELFTTTLFSDANLISYYRMEGNSNDARGSNDGSDIDVSYGSRYGKFNQGASFNGISSYITKNNPIGLPIGNGDITITGWIYFTANQSSGISGYVSWGAESSNQMAGLGFGPPGPNGLFWLGYINDASVSWSYATGTWYMVSATYTASSKQVQFYTNGSAQGSAVTLSNTPNVGSVFLNIGKQRPGNGIYLEGYADDVAIFSRVLSANEILDLYIGTLPKTLVRINDLTTNGAGKSGKVPPGLLIAPGIENKLSTATISL
ncbi:MAG: LamG domain-containing protein [Patescibacteria group bacterium]